MRVWAGVLGSGSRVARALQAGVRAGVSGCGSALFPELCWLCGARPAVDGLGCEEHALAPASFFADEARCRGCACLLPEGLASGICAACRRTPRGFGRLVAGGAYERGALRDWILALKHGRRRDLARPLAHFLAEAWRRDGGPPPGVLLTGVPLHPLRRIERGYDQARLLCEELGEVLGLRTARTLRRQRWTAPQGSPGARARSANVAGAFAPRPGLRDLLAGRPVWLVDDVITSGATVRACAEVLRRAEAREVNVLALGRVAPPGESDEEHASSD